MSKSKKVALVLGGGGALGCAHIGVIKALEKHNIHIDMIVGTSIGGLVASAYAVGLDSKAMTEFATKFRTINFVDVNFENGGVFSGKGVMKIVNKFLPDISIESLPVEFACVATDLVEEKAVVFCSGSLRDAVRATISIPGIFVPFKKDGRTLIDGGFINNLPEDVAVEMGADVIISCDVLTGCKVRKKSYNAIDAMLYAINISTKEIQKFKAYHSDILIQPDMTGLGQLTFSKSRTLKAIARGEEATEEKIEEIISLVGRD